jgi:crossover junction endodeoxyribonuclease RusA
MALIELPFPSSQLSGHGNKHFWLVRPIINAHRELAKEATKSANATVPDEGDIRVSVTFYPPSNRGDRVNYPNRMKPYWDGIADALGVNDRRFLPSFHFAEPCKHPCIVVRIGE